MTAVRCKVAGIPTGGNGAGSSAKAYLQHDGEEEDAAVDPNELGSLADGPDAA